MKKLEGLITEMNNEIEKMKDRFVELQDLEVLGLQAGITDWDMVELLMGSDEGFYIDLAQIEPDDTKEIPCVEVHKTNNRSLRDGLYVYYAQELINVRKKKEKQREMMQK